MQIGADVCQLAHPFLILKHPIDSQNLLSGETADSILILGDHEFDLVFHLVERGQLVAKVLELRGVDLYANGGLSMPIGDLFTVFLNKAVAEDRKSVV